MDAVGVSVSLFGGGTFNLTAFISFIFIVYRKTNKFSYTAVGSVS